MIHHDKTTGTSWRNLQEEPFHDKHYNMEICTNALLMAKSIMRLTTIPNTQVAYIYSFFQGIGINVSYNEATLMRNFLTAEHPMQAVVHVATRKITTPSRYQEVTYDYRSMVVNDYITQTHIPSWEQVLGANLGELDDKLYAIQDKLDLFHNEMDEVKLELRQKNIKKIAKSTGKPEAFYSTPEWEDVLDMYEELKDKKRVAGEIGNGESFIYKNTPTQEEFEDMYDTRLWNEFNNGPKQEHEDFEVFAERKYNKYLQQLNTLKKGFDFDIDSPIANMFPNQGKQDIVTAAVNAINAMVDNPKYKK